MTHGLHQHCRRFPVPAKIPMPKTRNTLAILAGMGGMVESLLGYLELHEDERGHERAQQAQRLMETARGLPGSTLARASQEVFVRIGTVLQAPDTTTIAALDGHFARLALLLRPLIAWALASAYQQQGQHERG